MRLSAYDEYNMYTREQRFIFDGFCSEQQSTRRVDFFFIHHAPMGLSREKLYYYYCRWERGSRFRIRKIIKTNSNKTQLQQNKHSQLLIIKTLLKDQYRWQ